MTDEDDPGQTDQGSTDASETTDDGTGRWTDRGGGIDPDRRRVDPDRRRIDREGSTADAPSPLAGATSGATYKVLGEIDDRDGIGVVGRNLASTGTPKGVVGETPQAGDTLAYGLVGVTAATRNNAAGVYGSATASGKGGTGVVGVTEGFGRLFFGTPDPVAGVEGIANASTGYANGVTGITTSRTDGNAGVEGLSNAATGETYGLKGTAYSSEGYGIYTPDDARLEGDVEATSGHAFTVAGTPTLRLGPTEVDSFGNPAGGNVVGGHPNNAASGTAGAVVGGGGSETYPNVVTDDYGVVGGGEENRAGDAQSGAGNATHAVVAGGNWNQAEDTYASVLGGYRNFARALRSTIGGGAHNVSDGMDATVGGGEGNEATDEHATVGGGNGNVAGGHSATVAGGQSNDAFGKRSTVGGGFSNRVGTSGTDQAARATIPGGMSNVAEGDHSFAAGYGAEAYDAGAFVWADDQGGTAFRSDTAVATTDPTGTNTFSVRAHGGVRFVTGASKATFIPSGSTGWATSSSRAVKTAVEPTDPEAILDGVERMEVSTWEYEGGEGGGLGVRHVGPMAEDFHEVLDEDLGNGDRHINTINADGVAFAAIQGLAARLDDARTDVADAREELAGVRDELADARAERDANADRIAGLEAANAALRDENGALRERNDRLEDRLSTVEDRLGTGDAGGAAPADD